MSASQQGLDRESAGILEACLFPEEPEAASTVIPRAQDNHAPASGVNIRWTKRSPEREKIEFLKQMFYSLLHSLHKLGLPQRRKI